MSNELQEKQGETTEKVESEVLARYFKYFSQYNNPYITVKIDFNKVRSKTCYDKHKKYFDKLAEVCQKYRINHQNYIKFCIIDEKIREPKEMLSVERFVRYSNKLKLKEQYMKIYEYYMKSAKNVAYYCIENDTTPLEYIRSLIINNKLGYEYITGGLSKYYIASFQNFKKIFFKLDRINQDELRIIYDVADELNSEVQNAFLMFKNQKVKPLSLAETIINQIKNK